MKNKTIKKNIHSKNHTMKIYGGDIDKKTIFRKILSIGYELETSSFAKLNLIGDDHQKKSMSRTLSRSVSISQSKHRSTAISKKNNNLPILLNTDTVPKDYEVIKRIKNDDYTE
jgi:hypothetical protein